MGLVPLHQIGEPDLAASVARDVERVGVSAAAGVIPLDEVRHLRTLVDDALRKDARSCPPDREVDVGRVVFLPRYGREFLDLLDRDGVMAPCEEILGPDCTLYTMTTLCQPPHSAHRPLHVDTQYAVPGFIVWVGVMLMLDDFTMSSGPTRMHPDVTINAPEAADFEARALRLEAPAGAACWFHGRIWHDALPNTTDHWRRAILIAMVRPWARQRFDVARMVAHLDLSGLAPRVHRRLGFDHIPPGSYEEYYLPDSTRKAELLRRALSSASEGLPPT